MFVVGGIVAEFGVSKQRETEVNANVGVNGFGAFRVVVSYV